MLVLGLQGSPRKKGNTNYLLKTFMNEAEKAGARTHVISVVKKNITPCIGCGVCEKKGFCVTQDDVHRYGGVQALASMRDTKPFVPECDHCRSGPLWTWLTDSYCT